MNHVGNHEEHEVHEGKPEDVFLGGGYDVFVLFVSFVVNRN
jgi:hypothetical protein